MNTKIQKSILAGIIGTAVMTAVMMVAPITGMPKMEGSMMAMMIGSLMGHIIFGMTVAKVVGNAYCADKTCEAKTAKYGMYNRQVQKNNTKIQADFLQY